MKVLSLPRLRLLAAMWVIGALALAQDPSKPPADRPVIGQEQKRREISQPPHEPSLFERYSLGYGIVVVVPLMVYILIIGAVRRRDS